MAKKIRIESEIAPASTGFRSQGMIAGDILFTAGQVGTDMIEPGVMAENTEDMGEAVRITLSHLEKVTLAAGLGRDDVFEVSAFPRVTGQKDLIYTETNKFLGAELDLFSYQEVGDVAAHSLLEMDCMAGANDDLSKEEATKLVKPLGTSQRLEIIDSGPFLIMNRLQGNGENLGAASEALLEGLKTELHARDLSMDSLIKMTVYIYAFDPYPLFNEVTQRYFADIAPPARSVLVAPEVTGDAKISIDLIAIKA